MHQAVGKVEVSIVNDNGKRDTAEKVRHAIFAHVAVKLTIAVFHRKIHQGADDAENGNAAQRIKKLPGDALSGGVLPLNHAVEKPFAQQHPKQEKCAACKGNITHGFDARVNKKMRERLFPRNHNDKVRAFCQVYPD